LNSCSSIITFIKNRLFEVFSSDIQKLDSISDNHIIYNWKHNQQIHICLKSYIKLIEVSIILIRLAGFILNDKIFAIVICYFILHKDYNEMQYKS